MPKRVDPEYLQGPIPGMSLTSEPGNRPWENPPVYVNVEDVVAFYTEQILDPETEDFVVLTLEKGISVEAAADHLVTSGVMNGMHTADVAFLVTPVVRELLMYVGDSAGVEYVESYDKAEQEKRIPRKLAKQIAEEVFAEELKQEEPAPEPAPAMGGLMARRPAPVTAGVTGATETAAMPAGAGLMSGGTM
jgi:hypothetical protein